VSVIIRCAERERDLLSTPFWLGEPFGFQSRDTAAAREIVANEADSGSVLHKEGNVYVGTLPKDGSEYSKIACVLIDTCLF
jgi:hypothetical protein